MSRTKTKQATKERPVTAGLSEVDMTFTLSDWTMGKLSGPIYETTVSPSPQPGLYDMTAVSQDMGEVMNVSYRVEAKIDKALESLARIETKLTKNEEEPLPREVPDEDARREILLHLKGKKVCYPSDIAYDLNLDYDQVSRILNQLAEEGVVGPHA